MGGTAAPIDPTHPLMTAFLHSQCKHCTFVLYPGPVADLVCFISELVAFFSISMNCVLSTCHTIVLNLFPV
eukprot:m.48411 g.48411  ORF g.48411 m.48411 type:complete len:71 (+) comp33880_c0_seq16:1325-1537(+)